MKYLVYLILYVDGEGEMTHAILYLNPDRIRSGPCFPEAEIAEIRGEVKRLLAELGCSFRYMRKYLFMYEAEANVPKEEAARKDIKLLISHVSYTESDLSSAIVKTLI